MLKIKLKDFLEFVNFRDAGLDGNKVTESTKIIRIYYPDMEDNRSSYNRDRYFEYGVYDFSHDTLKRISQTLNPEILELRVSEIGVLEESGILQIIVVYPDEIDEYNIDRYGKKNKDFTDDNIKRIFVSSPLAGDYEENISKARTYCRWVISQGYMPLAPHVYYTNFLKDDSLLERQLGMDMGLHWLAESDELWVFKHYGVSQGMKVEIDMAKRLSIPIKYIDCDVEDLKYEGEIDYESSKQ